MCKYHPVILLTQIPNVGRRILLEQQLERVDVVELHPADAPHEPLAHGLVASYVHVLYVVKLSIR